ncbi:RNA-binding domain-containing protein [Byssothecium circinans]|uniref:RNA-binding domain-containing protein n=1 Tax=Byssothecium circinans TaxID=147558 RepID=A0A6A5T6M8_9PLEO|nr:RNA-binding domain-containing protein [Byssothecium circinans]
MALVAQPPPGLPPKTAPNQTLYVRNLPDKLPKDDLKRNLYMLFASYGVILDIIALKTPKMRGQAHVVFRDIDASTQAMRALHGFNFFGKDMSIHYAKGKSHAFAKLSGTFYLPGKEPAAIEGGEQTSLDGFGAAPAKAVPANQRDRAKGMKRGREDAQEESESESGSESESESESDEDKSEADKSDKGTGDSSSDEAAMDMSSSDEE